MNKKIIDENENQDDIIEDLFEEDTEEQIKNNLPSFSSERLADLVVSYRYLGFYKNISLLAMEELSKRRVGGDDFKYEDYIEKNLNELPSLNFDIKNLDSLLQAFKGFKNVK